MVAIIGGEFRQFRPLIDIYREAGKRAGFTPDQLTVGIHAIGFLGDTTQQAADDYFPGYAYTFTKIGKERGWPPVTRTQFDNTRGPEGALLVGDATSIAEKILHVNEILGGISRLTFQITVATLPHPKLLHSIELIGTKLAPLIRKHLPSAVGNTT
jgi:alkanesulfonate monooxygenase SsuD/methylene tetrahydromethanopterin reductase-like flavin-dependent oxidoreductase (luciferase family)